MNKFFQKNIFFVAFFENIVHIKRKGDKMKKTAENGRSMVEMLGVLAIAGVLSIGGIIGYKQAMEKQQSNALMFAAEQYAGIIFTGKGALNDQYGNPKIPTADELNLNPLKIGISVTNNYLRDTGVKLRLSFFNANLCRISAELVGETCILAQNVCRTNDHTGLTDDDRARIVGCFDHVFETR